MEENKKVEDSKTEIKKPKKKWVKVLLIVLGVYLGINLIVLGVAFLPLGEASVKMKQVLLTLNLGSIFGWIGYALLAVATSVFRLIDYIVPGVTFIYYEGNYFEQSGWVDLINSRTVDTSKYDGAKITYEIHGKDGYYYSTHEGLNTALNHYASCEQVSGTVKGYATGYVGNGDSISVGITLYPTAEECSEKSGAVYRSDTVRGEAKSGKSSSGSSNSPQSILDSNSMLVGVTAYKTAYPRNTLESFGKLTNIGSTNRTDNVYYGLAYKDYLTTRRYNATTLSYNSYTYLSRLSSKKSTTPASRIKSFIDRNKPVLLVIETNNSSTSTHTAYSFVVVGYKKYVSDLTVADLLVLDPATGQKAVQIPKNKASLSGTYYVID